MIGQKLTRDRLFLLLILAAGTFLRLWNINWGLPGLYEEATPLVKSWNMWNWSGHGIELNPHFFNYPALSFYLLFLVQGIQYTVGHLIGIYPNPQSFGSSLSSIVVPGRLLIGLFDTGSIFAAYLLTKELAGKNTALIAAALVAFNPLHIIQAHYITVDTPLTFLTLIALYQCFKIRRQPSIKEYCIAGLWIGLAAGTKYTGAFVLMMLVLVHLANSETLRDALRSLTDPRLLAGLSASVVAFLAVNPYLLLSLDEFRRDFGFEQYHVASGHLGVDLSKTTLDYYLLSVLPQYLGWILFAVLLASVGFVLVKRDKQRLVFLAFPVVYIAIVSTWEMRAERYLLPVIPLLLIICAIGIGSLWHQIEPRIAQVSRKLALPVVAVGFGIALMIQPALSVYDFQQGIILPDTRTVALSWIEQHLPPGSAIATGPFGIQIPEQRYSVLDIPFLAFESERIAPFYNTKWYEDCDLLIASDYDYGRYAKEPSKYAEFLPYYDSLRATWKLVSEFKPEGHQMGPTLWFYTHPDSLRHESFDAQLFESIHGSVESTKISSFMNTLSGILLRKKRFAKCEQAAREILTVETDNLRARNDLAQAMLAQGNYQGALLQIQKSLHADPSQAELFSLAGDILLKMGREREAELSYLKALQVNQYFSAPYQALISFYTERNDKKSLTGILQRYYAILPKKSNEAKRIQERLQELNGSS